MQALQADVATAELWVPLHPALPFPAPFCLPSRTLCGICLKPTSQAWHLGFHAFVRQVSVSFHFGVSSCTLTAYERREAETLCWEQETGKAMCSRKLRKLIH